MKLVFTNADLLSPYGVGLECCRRGLLAGRSAIAETDRFPGRSFVTTRAATVPSPAPCGEATRLMAMLLALFTESPPHSIPADSALLLASAVGEIELLERRVLHREEDLSEASLSSLLDKVKALARTDGQAMVVSAACASSTVALARAEAMIRSGTATAVAVVGCDEVSEFVFSGFSTLMALSPTPARPFDADRDGLTLGEAAALTVLMTEDRAIREGRRILGELLGTGCSSDANHMTGPSRDGDGLARAVKTALTRAKMEPCEVTAICAHGTGTRYNDSMEMKAFDTVFPEPVPTFSVKGGTGHTLGAAGLLEALVALGASAEGIAPPTVGLVTPDQRARGWVSREPVRITNGGVVLSTNSGFGGVNAAVLLRGCG